MKRARLVQVPRHESELRIKEEINQSCPHTVRARSIHVTHAHGCCFLPTLTVTGPRASLHFKPTEVRAAVVTCGGLCPGLNSVIHHLVVTLLKIYNAEKVRVLLYYHCG